MRSMASGYRVSLRLRIIATSVVTGAMLLYLACPKPNLGQSSQVVEGPEISGDDGTFSPDASIVALFNNDGPVFFEVKTKRLISIPAALLDRIVALRQSSRTAKENASVIASSYGEVLVAADKSGRYLATAENEGHGNIHLHLRVDGLSQPIEVAQGNWELQTFILDVPRNRLLYPGESEAIFAFDLTTRRTIPMVQRTGSAPRLLDESSDGKTIAYSVSGHCAEERNVNVTYLPRRLCIVSLR
jgi:hypothetical protein